MCTDSRIVFFGCTCRIEYPNNVILGIQPCNSARPPHVCDPRLNNRPRFPLLSPATRFSMIWCAAHVEAGAAGLDKDGKELLPIVYNSLPEFLASNAFDNNKLIERVKNRLAYEARVAQLLKGQLKAFYEELEKEEALQEANDRARAAQATAERETVERAAGGTLGALRPNLGPGFAALELRTRNEEAKAQRALEDTLMKKREKAAQEARGVPNGASSQANDNEATRSDRPGLKQWTCDRRAERTSNVRGAVSTAPTIAETIAERRGDGSMVKGNHASGHKTKPSRKTAERDVTPLAEASRDAASKAGLPKEKGAKIASSRKLPSRPKVKEKEKEKASENNSEKLGNKPEKVMDLEGNDLYE